MDETRAVARLPHLDIEIRHAKAPDETAEYLSITLKATPDLNTAVGVLDPATLMRAWMSMNPWLAWMSLAAPFSPFAAMLPKASPSAKGEDGR